MNLHWRTLRIGLLVAGLLAVCASMPQAQHIALFDPSTPELKHFPRPQSILECGRAIHVLSYGLSQHWTGRDQYITEFERSESRGTAGDDLGEVRDTILRFLKAQLHDHRIWDEKPGLEAEVRHAISVLSEERDELLEQERKASAK